MSVYNEVADHYGLDVSDDLKQAVDDSKVTSEEWQNNSNDARQRVKQALNNVTNRRIKDEMNTSQVLLRPGMDNKALAQYIFQQMQAAGIKRD